MSVTTQSLLSKLLLGLAALAIGSVVCWDAGGLGGWGLHSTALARFEALQAFSLTCRV